MSASRCRFETSKTSSMSAALTSAMRRSGCGGCGSDRLMADVNAALMEEVFDVSKRQREADIHHHGQSNDLGRRLKVPKWAMGHGAANLRLTGRSDKPRCLDTARLCPLKPSCAGIDAGQGSFPDALYLCSVPSSIPHSEACRTKGISHACPRAAAALVALRALRWRATVQTD